MPSAQHNFLCCSRVFWAPSMQRKGNNVLILITALWKINQEYILTLKEAWCFDSTFDSLAFGDLKRLIINFTVSSPPSVYCFIIIIILLSLPWVWGQRWTEVKNRWSLGLQTMNGILFYFYVKNLKVKKKKKKSKSLVGFFFRSTRVNGLPSWPSG